MATNEYLTWFATGAKIMTPQEKEKPVEELKAGDFVIDHNGAVQCVVSIYSRTPDSDDRLCGLKTRVRPDESLVLSSGAVVLNVPWFNSNPERWAWKSLKALDLAHNCVVVFDNGYGTGAQGERSMDFRSTHPDMAGKKMYALQVDGLEQSIIANGVGVKVKMDACQREIPKHEEILYFIKEFHKAKTTFTTGCCYWFAQILSMRFGGTTMYNQVENHWVQRIGNRLYDVTGDVTEQYPNAIEWAEFQRMEPGCARRLTEDCIDILPPGEV